MDSQPQVSGVEAASDLQPREPDISDVLDFVLKGDRERVVGVQTVYQFDQELRLTWNALPVSIRDGMYAAAMLTGSLQAMYWLNLLEFVSEANRVHVLAEVVYAKIRMTPGQPWWLINVLKYCNVHLQAELPKYVELARPFLEIGEIASFPSGTDLFDLIEFVEKFDMAVAERAA